MSTFTDFVTEARRLAILQRLAERPEFTADEFSLRRELAAVGHSVALDALRTDLAWLEEQKLVIAQQPGGAWVATLTVRGEDASRGLARVPGVARPRP